MDYFLDAVSGNDANNGLTVGTAKQTINGFLSSVTLVDGDRAFLLNGTYTLTANASVSVDFSWLNYAGASPVIDGPYFFTATGGATVRWKGLDLQNAGGTNGSSGIIGSGNAGNKYVVEDCEFNLNYSAGIFTNMSPASLAFYNCEFNLNGTTSAQQLMNGNGHVFTNCKFKSNVIDTNTYLIFESTSTTAMEFIGCEFIGFPAVVFSNNASSQSATSWKFCTFDGTDGLGSGVKGHFWRYTQSSNITNAMQFRLIGNLFYNLDKMVDNTSSGVGSMDDTFIANNFIQSTIDITNYNSLGGDVIASDPEFYDASTNDYRLEATSPAALLNNGLTFTMGANELEHPSVFYTSIPEAKVENLYDYRDLSRVDNKTGTLTGGGGDTLTFNQQFKNSLLGIEE